MWLLGLRGILLEVKLNDPVEHFGSVPASLIGQRVNAIHQQLVDRHGNRAAFGLWGILCSSHADHLHHLGSGAKELLAVQYTTSRIHYSSPAAPRGVGVVAAG
jgi:hypothetical protein